jgi:hypothetical protein
MRQAALLVKFDDRGLGVRSQLGRGGAEGVGRLQGMPALNPAAALTALTDVDVELAVNGLGRDLDLELLGDVRLVERATAIGASVGQGRLVSFVELLRGWRLAMRLRAVVLAGLASWLLGLAGRTRLTGAPGSAGRKRMPPLGPADLPTARPCRRTAAGVR